MFGFLFGRKKSQDGEGLTADGPGAEAAAAAKTAPGTRIGYSPGLVDELKRDHQRMLGLFARIGTASAGGDMAEAARLLEEFRSALARHLLKENVRFYVYVEHAVAGDPARHALVHRFRHDMDGIGKAVLAFLDRYRDLAGDPALAGAFGAELAAIGKVLVERIHSEEASLYALYRPLG